MPRHTTDVQVIIIMTSQPRLAVLRCAVVVGCHLANRLAVRENERNIAHYGFPQNIQPSIEHIARKLRQ